MFSETASVFAQLHAWSGEGLHLHHDRETGADVIVAIHSTVLGPAGGGTRMKRYDSREEAVSDAMRLAESMTWKFAVAGISQGGGKAVVALDRPLEQRERAAFFRRYGTLVRSLGGLYNTGPDVGTTPEDMDVAYETGAPWVFGRTPATGGCGGSGPPTADGVCAGIRAAFEHVDGSAQLDGKVIAVQGAGGVGRRLAELLHDAGAELLIADPDPAALEPLLALERVSAVDPSEIAARPCDLFAPCALGGVLDRETIEGLRCRIVAGAANNQLAEPEGADLLRARGIVLVPDFVINAGGAVGVLTEELHGGTPEDASERVAAIGDTVREVLARAERDGVTPEVAALALARARLEDAADPGAPAEEPAGKL